MTPRAMAEIQRLQSARVPLALAGLERPLTRAERREERRLRRQMDAVEKASCRSMFAALRGRVAETERLRDRIEEIKAWAHREVRLRGLRRVRTRRGRR